MKYAKDQDLAAKCAVSAAMTHGRAAASLHAVQALTRSAISNNP
jgi:hypothetical protein